MTVVDHVRAHARVRPGHPAVIIAGSSGADDVVTYADLIARVDAAAARLRAEGARPGERCGLIAKQGFGFIEAALGILAADLCLVPIPDAATVAARAHHADESRLGRLVDEADGFASRPVGSRLPDDVEDALRAIGAAYLRFTSGTTHRHRGVVIGHRAVLERLAAANEALAISPDDRIVWLLPMAHHFVVSILLYLRFGATILLPSAPLAAPILGLAARARATVLYASPYHYGLLASDDSKARLDAVRLAVSTADGLRADVAQRFAHRFHRPLVQALGIIEVGLPIMNRASASSKPTALGRPLPAYDVWLRGDDGRPVVSGAPDATGEICIRGPGMFDAYLDPWTPARDVVDPDGFRTGDLAWRDGDGDLHLAGRRANRISMAGMKFFCEEVEAVLETHPMVRRSRVMARSHAHLGEIPVAEIVPADPARPPKSADLTVHCAERLASYKIPRRFTIVDAIPLTATGKVVRWDRGVRPTDDSS